MEEIKVIQGINYIHLFSGGLDSTYSLFDLCREFEKRSESSKIQPIFLDYGQYASIAEWTSVNNVIKFIQSELHSPEILNHPIIVNLRSDLFIWSKSVAFNGIQTKDSDPEIENRNMVLLSILYSYAIACARNQNIHKAIFEVYGGFKDGEIADCKASFFNSLSQLMKQYHPEYIMNFHLLPAKFDRQTTINAMKRLLKGSEDKLKRLKGLTISCYSPINGEACGKCWKCLKISEGKL